MASLLVLHTCESDGTAEANAEYLVRIGAEPHWVFDPRFGLDEAIQLLPYTQTGKALRNLAGGVETNRRERDNAGGVDVVQIEIVGYADQVAGYDDRWYANLRAFIAEICAATGVPLVFPRTRFAIRYGDDVRFTPGEWSDPALAGVVGHCHVPENDHWDPGPIDVARLTAPTLQEIIMGCFQPDSPITVSGHQYAAQDVFGWILERLNAMAVAAPAGSPMAITPAQIADELAKRLAA